jgi:hypothetical protein
MTIFVQATDHDINMHGKIQYLILHSFFVNNYFSIQVLGILYNKLLLKCEFNQAHWLELLKSIHTKFIL